MQQCAGSLLGRVVRALAVEGGRATAAGAGGEGCSRGRRNPRLCAIEWFSRNKHVVDEQQRVVDRQSQQLLINTERKGVTPRCPSQGPAPSHARLSERVVSGEGAVVSDPLRPKIPQGMTVSHLHQQGPVAPAQWPAVFPGHDVAAGSGWTGAEPRPT